jgi:hypothetical protein
MAELHENLDKLISMDSWNLNFDSGSKKYMGILVMEISISI